MLARLPLFSDACSFASAAAPRGWRKGNIVPCDCDGWDEGGNPCKSTTRSVAGGPSIGCGPNPLEATAAALVAEDPTLHPYETTNNTTANKGIKIHARRNVGKVIPDIAPPKSVKYCRLEATTF